MSGARQSLWSEQMQLKFAALEKEVSEALLTSKDLGVKLFELLQDLDIPNSVLEGIRELRNNLDQQRLSQVTPGHSHFELPTAAVTGVRCQTSVLGGPGFNPRPRHRFI
uniref:(California timema) hypothetical protein n=1 Tax=Timema californicum TaxID=61474 RepID=A0A7R9JM06_TIMCA|nr:unnamed protein product [Timema californicum]